MEEAERGKAKERELEKTRKKMEERTKSLEGKEKEERAREKETKDELERRINALERELEDAKKGSLKMKATLDNFESSKEDLASLHVQEVEGLSFQLKKANDRVRDLTTEL